MIYEKKCQHCGKEFETRYEEQKFCCSSCGNKSRRSNDFDHSLNWVRDTESKWVCPYQPEGTVHCKVRKCSSCGWNPEVAKARLDAYIRKYQEEQNG